VAATLYLRLTAADAAEWLLQGPGAGTGVRRGTLAELAAAAAGCKLVLLAPAADVLLIQAKLPTRQRQRMLRALPYALEERLADEVENLHFAAGRADDDGVAAAVVERGRLQGWLGQLVAAGLRPDAVLPESLGVPVGAQSWGLLLEAGGGLLRSGPSSACSLDPLNAAELLRLALEQAGEARPGSLRLFDAGAEPALLEALAAVCAEAGVELRREAGEALPLLVRHLDPNARIDLLQGEFSRREQLGQSLRLWRPAAAMLAALALLQGGMAMLHYRDLTAQDRRLRAQIEQLYRHTFPDAKRVVNARLQMQQRLKALSSDGHGGGLAPLLARAAPVLARTAGLQLRALRYRDGALEVDLGIGNLRSLDGLKQALLAAGGLAVSIDAANAQNGRVDGRLTLRGVGA